MPPQPNWSQETVVCPILRPGLELLAVLLSYECDANENSLRFELGMCWVDLCP